MQTAAAHSLKMSIFHFFHKQSKSTFEQVFSTQTLYMYMHILNTVDSRYLELAYLE